MPRPLHGNAPIARAFIGFAQLPSCRGWRLVPTTVNGLPGCLVIDDLASGRFVQTIARAPSAHEPGRAQSTARRASLSLPNNWRS